MCKDRGEQSIAQPPESEETIVRYLLDEMPAPERDKFEERFSQEPAFLETVSATEDDLIMQYVCGRLDARLSARFEEIYMQAPARRARVEAARALREAVQDASASSAERQRPVSSAIWRVALLAAAAMIVLAILVVPLWKRGPVTHNPIHSIGRQVAIALEPGQVRAGGGAQLSVPSDAQQVRFELAWPASATEEKYRVTLGTPEHPSVWSGAAVRQGPSLIATAPANILVSGDYSIELQAGRGEAWEEVAAYYFRVVR